MSKELQKIIFIKTFIQKTFRPMQKVLHEIAHSSV